MVSHWLAWISFGFSILLLLKFVARKSKITQINRVFSKSHKTSAIIMMMTGLAHGTISLIKGTRMRHHKWNRKLGHGTILHIKGAWRIAAIISGIVLFVSALFVCHTCIHRHSNKRTWMRMHQIGSVVLMILLLIHLIFTLII